MSDNENIVWLDISNIKPHPKNPNTHPSEQIERLVKLIEYQGWRVPLIISKQTGFLIAGHGRLMAAKKMGSNKVPVLYQDFDDEDQEYAFMTSDNAIASWANLELAQINEDLQYLDGSGFDIELLGIKDFGLTMISDFPDISGEDPEFKQVTYTFTNEQHKVVSEYVNSKKDKEIKSGDVIYRLICDQKT